MIFVSKTMRRNRRARQAAYGDLGGPARPGDGRSGPTGAERGKSVAYMREYPSPLADVGWRLAGVSAGRASKYHTRVCFLKTSCACRPGIHQINHLLV